MAGGGRSPLCDAGQQELSGGLGLGVEGSETSLGFTKFSVILAFP